MINAIIEAVSAALNGEFGDGCEIYMEEIEQGLKEPCFFISCLNSTNELSLGKRYFRSCQLCIQYFPATREKKRECNSVAERLWQCLEYITIFSRDRQIRGTKMSYEVVDGVLNFFVNYDRFVFKTEVLTPMDDLETNTNVKEGE